MLRARALVTRARLREVRIVAPGEIHHLARALVRSVAIVLLLAKAPPFAAYIDRLLWLAAFGGQNGP